MTDAGVTGRPGLRGRAAGYAPTMAQDEAPQDEAPRTTTPDDADPYVEPPNSTVDDWLGQRVQRDEELAERLVAESDGDLAEAERRFEQESDERQAYEAAHIQDDARGE